MILPFDFFKSPSIICVIRIRPITFTSNCIFNLSWGIDSKGPETTMPALLISISKGSSLRIFLISSEQVVRFFSFGNKQIRVEDPDLENLFEDAVRLQEHIISLRKIL